MTKKHILTGCQPSSDQLHIGNYFGAVKPMIDLQKTWEFDKVTMFIADLHACTKILDRDLSKLPLWTLNMIKLYIACGLDPEKVFMFKQSDVPAHAELTWIFNCFTHVGFMQRMHVYKDAINAGKEHLLSIGSMNYPILMAADILLYDPDLIPVGQDNKQHIEYMRDTVSKIHHKLKVKDLFKTPDAYIQKDIAEVPWLDGRKMSKSYDNYLWLLDSPELLLKKVKKIQTTDLLPEDPKDPDACCVYAILKLFLNSDEDTIIRNRYATWISYKELKDMTYEKLMAFVVPIQTKFAEIDDSYVREILTKNAIIANEIANKKIDKVYKAIGLRN
jgi:tryptophanyl-tRNA synthetase